LQTMELHGKFFGQVATPESLRSILHAGSTHTLIKHTMGSGRIQTNGVSEAINYFLRVEKDRFSGNMVCGEAWGSACSLFRLGCMPVNVKSLRLAN